MIVVDTNVIAYLFLRGEHSAAVDRLLRVDSDWVAPRLWLDEFLNVLTISERAGVINSVTSNQILQEACELMEGRDYDVNSERVLATARRTGCSAYDSQYVCLAEDLGVRLYTFDKGILAKQNKIALKPS